MKILGNSNQFERKKSILYETFRDIYIYIQLTETENYYYY